MKKTILLIFTLLFCFAFEALCQKPAWVETRPVDSSYYIGIVQVKKSNTDFMKIARQEALQEISNEISTIIISNIQHSISEIDKSVSELFSSHVQSYSSNQLEGYELFQKWEDGDECWVYYRLSKIKHEEIREEKLRSIKTASIENLKIATKNEAIGNIEQALYFAFSALKTIEEYYFDNLKCQLGGELVYLNIETLKLINEIFSKIEIRNQTERLTLKHSFPINTQLRFKTLYNNTLGQTNLSNLPFKVSFTNGDGFISSDEKSESDSICATLVQINSVQPNQTIEVKFNTAYQKS